MQMPKLAVYTLVVMAAQDFGQSVSAKPLSLPEPMPEDFSVAAQSSQSKFTAASQSAPAKLATVPTSAPIANIQGAFNQVEFSHTAIPLQASPQFQPFPAVAQTTTIDQLEGNPSEENPPDDPPNNSTAPEPSGETPAPDNADRPAPTTPLPGSEQYLQDENRQEEPPEPVPSSVPSSVPVSPSSPEPAPTAPSNPSAAPTASPVPASSGVLNAPIAPVVQIGNVILPHRGALPSNFVFPIRIRVTIDPSVTTNTPITNSTNNLASWEERVRACLDEKPQIFAVDADGMLAPILFDGRQGSILRNANGRMVCATLS